MKVTKEKFIFSAVLILLIFTGCSTMKSTDLINLVIPANTYEKKQLVYGSKQRQSLDLYIPKSKEFKTPIVFVYGGAWRKGSKQDYTFVAHALAGLGHPVVIPDYRLFPEVTFPLFINDVADAIVAFEKNAEKILNKPLDNIILMGHSSGAHSAALLVTNQKYLKTRNFKTKISGFIGMSGPYDLPLDDPEVKPVFKNATEQETNPILNIHSSMPSVLLIHGLDDERVKPFHTQRFEKALLNSGVTVTTHMYEGVNHTRIIGSLAAPLRFLNSSYDDIKNYLKDFD